MVEGIRCLPARNRLKPGLRTKLKLELQAAEGVGTTCDEVLPEDSGNSVTTDEQGNMTLKRRRNPDLVREGRGNRMRWFAGALVLVVSFFFSLKSQGAPGA